MSFLSSTFIVVFPKFKSVPDVDAHFDHLDCNKDQEYDGDGNVVSLNNMCCNRV